jgi:hypothetical protein
VSNVRKRWTISAGGEWDIHMLAYVISATNSRVDDSSFTCVLTDKNFENWMYCWGLQIETMPILSSLFLMASRHLFMWDIHAVTYDGVCTSIVFFVQSMRLDRKKTWTRMTWPCSMQLAAYQEWSWVNTPPPNDANGIYQFLGRRDSSFCLFVCLFVCFFRVSISQLGVGLYER